MKNILLTVLFLIPVISHAQTEGIGFSSVYSLKVKVNALNEALFNAQENAAINSGSNVGRVSVGKSTNVLSENNTQKPIASFYSKKIDLRTNMIKAVVKTIGKPHYDTIWLTRKKYKVKVTGEFIVDHDNVANLLPELDELGEKIKIEVHEFDCYGRFYDYASEYFRQKQNAIFLSQQRFPLGETDFGMEVFSDRITLIDKKSTPNYSIRIFSVKSCNDLITHDYIENAILDEIRNEIFYYYLIR